MVSSEIGLLRAILYADIFDYPLTEEQLWGFYIGRKPLVEKKFSLKRSKLFDYIKQKDGYFFLKQREEIVSKRVDRAGASAHKRKLAEILSTYLSYIPTIQLIGISGGVAMENADEDDDIDLFLIVKKDTLWVTRFFALLLLQLIGRRRKRNSRYVADMICLNMFVDEAQAFFPKQRQDLYTAHEIAQLVPLFQRDESYTWFIKENAWIKHFLPHWREKKPLVSKKSFGRQSFFLKLCTYPLVLQLSKLLQRVYMKKHASSETIEDYFLAFHPNDLRAFVISEYKKRLELFDLE